MRKYILTYHKCWEARFLSHLELLRSVQRAFRRSGLPLHFSSGHNPRPRISFLTFPLPVGFTGEAERLEFALEEPIPEDEALAALRKNFRPGIVPESVSTADEKTPKGVGCCISFLIFLLFEEGTAESEAPPQTISVTDSLEATLASWDSVSESRIFAATAVPSLPPPFALEELFSAAYSLGPLCGDVTIRPDKIIREKFPSVRSLHIHRVSG
ncbi:MAG: TIGR03936 family radical SAM-associated protein [bacterium]